MPGTVTTAQSAAMESLDTQRQHAALDFLARGEELTIGDPATLPWPDEALAALRADAPGVEATHANGLTGVVHKLRVGAQAYAVKCARRPCLVQNTDGQTSFLNELLRHRELEALRAAGVELPGIVRPLYGSLRHGLIVSPWIEGPTLQAFDERTLRQVLTAGRLLCEHGFFEWDFSAGNMVDDGRQVWLFDFGYMYRYDPLTQFNTAGDGRSAPEFHLAERIETRHAFGWLLGIERSRGPAAALSHFSLVKRLALEAYRQMRRNLAARGASTQVLSWLDGICAGWSSALADASQLQALYLREAWRSHTADLDDDLRGRTCTRRTLDRADWLIDQAVRQHAQLSASGALHGADAFLGARELADKVRAQRQTAEGYLVDP